MTTVEAVIVFGQLHSSARASGHHRIANAVADNIHSLAQVMQKEASTPKNKKLKTDKVTPWWVGLTEDTFKEQIRNYLRTPGSDAEQVKRAMETYAQVNGSPYPATHLQWVDQIVQELGEG